MKRWILAGFLLFTLAAAGSAQSKPVSNATSVKRLDGSAITASEIDATVSRLMHAAEVTALN